MKQQNQEALIGLGLALLLGAFEGAVSGLTFTGAYYFVNDRWAWKIFWVVFAIAMTWEVGKSCFAIFAGLASSQSKD